jgi:hypothetical protein
MPQKHPPARTARSVCDVMSLPFARHQLPTCHLPRPPAMRHRRVQGISTERKPARRHLAENCLPRSNHHGPGTDREPSAGRSLLKLSAREFPLHKHHCDGSHIRPEPALFAGLVQLLVRHLANDVFQFLFEIGHRFNGTFAHIPRRCLPIGRASCLLRLDFIKAMLSRSAKPI